MSPTLREFISAANALGADAAALVDAMANATEIESVESWRQATLDAVERFDRAASALEKESSE